jgi:hypothetical protein
MSNVADKLKARIARPIFAFEVPEADRAWEGDPRTFELQQLTLLQELDAGRASDPGSPMSYVYAQLERALFSINGIAVDQGLPNLDNFSPQVRKLMIVAFDHICAPKAKPADFFAKMTKRLE